MPKFDENPYEHFSDIPLACSVAAGVMLSIGFLLCLELMGVLAGVFLFLMGVTARGIYQLVFNRIMAKANFICLVGGGVIFLFGFYNEPILLLPMLLLFGWFAVFWSNFDEL